MALKMTQVELDLITDSDMFLMIESGIREGGLSYVSRRFAEANHPILPNYRPEEPISYLCYLDANSLYATCQSFSLPVGDFRFLTQSEIDAFDVNSVSISRIGDTFLKSTSNTPSTCTRLIRHIHSVPNI